MRMLSQMKQTGITEFENLPICIFAYLHILQGQYIAVDNR